MQLLTKEIETKLKSTPIGSTDGMGLDAPLIVKFFNPSGAGTWLITEGEQSGDDWILFGYCHIHEWEWGSVSLNELQNFKGSFGLGIERDIYASGTIRDNI